MLNTIAALFAKVIVSVVKTLSVNPVRNIVLRWTGLKDPNNQSEPAKHLKYFPENRFEWKLLTIVPRHARKWTILEVFLVKSINPSLINRFDTILEMLWHDHRFNIVFGILLIVFIYLHCNNRLTC